MAKENNKGVSKATEKNTEKKTAKKAVKSIPTMPFEDVLHLSQAIWECASGKRVRKITLFDHLGKSPDSGPSRALITSSSKYGLTTGGYQAEYLELTEEGAKASNTKNLNFKPLEKPVKLVGRFGYWIKGENEEYLSYEPYSKGNDAVI